MAEKTEKEIEKTEETASKAERGSLPLKNVRHEQFAQYVAKGMDHTSAYSKVCGKEPQHIMKLVKTVSAYPVVRERIEYLKNIEASSWTKEKATKELKRIINDSETKARDRIQAISELNDIHGLKRPTQQHNTFENKGIFFNCPDGITLPPGFFESESKRLKDANEKKVIDVTANKKTGNG